MENIIEYLNTSIDDDAQFQIWNARKVFSLQLSGSYDFFLVQLLGEEFLLVRPYDQMDIRKMKIQVSLMEQQAKMPVAVLMEDITVYRMKKMIKEKIAFVIAGGQMYLPFMALHDSHKVLPRKVFSISITQISFKIC